MKKVVRILGLIQAIRQKTGLSKKIKNNLIRNLLFLEFKSYTQPDSKNEVVVNILGFKIHALGYKNLCLLFTEIFIHEEYKYFTGGRENITIADCGANIGIATIYLKWKFPKAKIHCFEPDPVAFSLLEKNIRENNFHDVSLYNMAVMSNDGTIDFYISSDTPASLLMSTLPQRMSEKKISVKGVDFRKVVADIKPDYLKMDIEGAEDAIFDKLVEDGSIKTFKEIILEYHHLIDGNAAKFSKMLHSLEQNGYEYNLTTSFNEAGAFQDILLYAFPSPQRACYDKTSDMPVNITD